MVLPPVASARGWHGLLWPSRPKNEKCVLSSTKSANIQCGFRVSDVRDPIRFCSPSRLSPRRRCLLAHAEANPLLALALDTPICALAPIGPLSPTPPPLPTRCEDGCGGHEELSCGWSNEKASLRLATPRSLTAPSPEGLFGIAVLVSRYARGSVNAAPCGEGRVGMTAELFYTK